MTKKLEVFQIAATLTAAAVQGQASIDATGQEPNQKARLNGVVEVFKDFVDLVVKGLADTNAADALGEAIKDPTEGTSGAGTASPLGNIAKVLPAAVLSQLGGLPATAGIADIIAIIQAAIPQASGLNPGGGPATQK